MFTKASPGKHLDFISFICTSICCFSINIIVSTFKIPPCIFVPRGIILYHVTLFCTTWHYIVPPDIVLCHVTLFCTTWHFFVARDIILCHVTLFCTTWHYFVPRDVFLYHVTFFCATWHYFVPRDIILYHVTLFRIKLINLYNAEIFLYKPWRRKGFFNS